MTFFQKIKSIAPFWLYCCLLTWWVSENCFFWDTVQLASKHAHWYYDNNFQHFFLPENIDSGHPPFFGIYLALIWCSFGKSLIVSHFSMLPFLLGITWLLQEIGIYLGDKKGAKYLILLVIADPFFAGQSILVSPDIILIFGFLLSIYAILNQRIFCLVIGNILLAFISMRGMMICFGLYIWWITRNDNKSNFLNNFYNKIPSNKKQPFFQTLRLKIVPFLPAGFLALSFLILHYQETGWIGYHLNSPWAESFEKVDFQYFVKNIGILIWRFLDYGRLFLLGGLAWLFFQIPKTKTNKWSLSFFTISSILFLILTPSLLVHKGLLSHRYLLPITISISLLFYHLLFRIIANKKTRTLVFSIAFLGLLAGNCWIYPKKIAQGWDATLAHLPYYHLRKKMIDYIDTQSIPYEEIGTVFPNIGPLEIYDLNDRQEGFAKKNFKKNKYLFYSTVFNDFSDKELAELESNWQKNQHFESFGIEVILFSQE